MGARQKPPSDLASASVSESAPETMRSSGWIRRSASHATRAPQCSSSIEPTMAGSFNSNFQYEDPPTFYPLTRHDSLWADGSNGTLPLGVCGASDKFLDGEVANIPHRISPSLFPDTASSLTYSPASSYQGSVWSPIQTDIASEITATGTARSRVPSPLRNVARFQIGSDGQYACLNNKCEATLSSKEDLELHSRVGHSHVCLWGDDGPCDSAGFATREELNWHVKHEHLLLCPVLGCAEGAFTNRDILDCHLKCAHGNTTDENTTPKPPNLLKTALVPSGRPATGSRIRASTTKSGSIEDKMLKMEMSIGISKKRCRERLKTVLDKRMKRINSSTPRAGESPEVIRCRTPKPLESASFPIVWEHGILPFLVEFIPKWCDSGHVISVTRGRKPNSRRICIMTKRTVSRARRLVIAGHVRDLLPEAYRNLTTFVFSTGKVERLVWSRGLSKEIPDEICPPRNPFCYMSPCMGDSIGTTSEDGDEITATLGPLVTVDDGSYWLVSFHPFVDASKGIRPVPVEHPSPADRADCSGKGHDVLDSSGLDFKLGNLTATSGFDLKTTRISHDPYWEECDKEPPLVVTDWALVSTSSRQANLLRKFPTTNQRRENPVTSMSSICPERTVCCTGRTSGFQRGQVCEIPAYIDGSENGTGRASREWFLEEPYPYDNEDDWIRGGIGVEGDSGAVIIDCESNAMIGQLWARNQYYGPGPRHTFFTPILDIFDDIQERCGQERRAQLPQFRDEVDRWPTYPVCRQCFDLREYLESRRSSGASLVSMIGIHEAGVGDIDNDLTSVSELATPKDQSHLVRHIGPDEASSSFGGIVSPAPIHAFYTFSQVTSPGNSDLRSPYAQALNDEDLYERCPDANEGTLGIRPSLFVPMEQSASQQQAKRRRLM